MIEAVANTNWSETGLRIVIVISDNSSWDESNVQQNPQRYSLDMVQILANQRRIRFLMVKIEGTCDENNDQEKHRQQCKLLANGKGPDTRGGYAEVNQGIENIPMYTAALDTFLYKEIMRTWQLMRVAIDWRKNYRPPFISSDDWAIILRNINSDLLDPNVIQPASFNTGWVLQQKVGAPANLSPTVMFDYSELSLYTYILGGFLTYIEPSSDEVLQLVIKDFEKKVGEAFPENMPIGDFLEKKTGLPIREGGLLDITPEAARNMFPEERRNLMDYLRKKKTYVDIFLSDQSNFISLGKTKYRVTFLPLDMMP